LIDAANIAVAVLDDLAILLSTAKVELMMPGRLCLAICAAAAVAWAVLAAPSGAHAQTQSPPPKSDKQSSPPPHRCHREPLTS
jgi:hypothetical protein